MRVCTELQSHAYVWFVLTNWSDRNITDASWPRARHKPQENKSLHTLCRLYMGVDKYACECDCACDGSPRSKFYPLPHVVLYVVPDITSYLRCAQPTPPCILYTPNRVCQVLPFYINDAPGNTRILREDVQVHFFCVSTHTNIEIQT